MEKFRNKFRIPSIRMRNWNYAGQATYFLTICTHKRIFYFGKISKGINHLSVLGNIVEEEWLKTPKIRPDMNITPDTFVVMPNHFHAIIGIGENIFNQSSGISLNTFGPQRKNLASIMRGFKSAVTARARLINPDFAWQAGFYDRIIWEDSDFITYWDYIKDNPKKWEDDEFH